MEKGFDFMYSGFGVSRANIRNYIDDLPMYWGPRQQDAYAIGLVTSMIHCIARNNVKFDPSDNELCDLLEELIKKGGHNGSGVYSAEAARAMYNLCEARGKNPAEYELHDRTVPGLFERAKSKIKKVFSFGKKSQPAPVRVHSGHHKKTWLYTILGAGVLGVASLGLKKDFAHRGDTAPVPTFKTVSVSDSVSHKATATYNLNDATRLVSHVSPAAPQVKSAPIAHAHQSVKAPAHAAPRMTATPRPASAHVTKSAVATDSLSVRLTRASKSALDILLGTKGAADLCAQVQSQINSGIFAAPNGMSAERIAHAMTMSRIYEGKSVILDALNAKTKLTSAQQAAFNQHIAEIGDMGRGIQQRMAAKHNLSHHSKYDTASKTLKNAHIKNLKQLKQLRSMSHTK